MRLGLRRIPRTLRGARIWHRSLQGTVAVTVELYFDKVRLQMMPKMYLLFQSYHGYPAVHPHTVELG